MHAQPATLETWQQIIDSFRSWVSPRTKSEAVWITKSSSVQNYTELCSELRQIIYKRVQFFVHGGTFSQEESIIDNFLAVYTCSRLCMNGCMNLHAGTFGLECILDLHIFCLSNM